MLSGAVCADEAWDCIVHMPVDSPLMAALAADPEYASDARPGPPSWTEFGPEVQALASVHDLLAAIYSAVTRAQVAPYPRPASAAQRRRRQQQWARHRQLTARLLPGKEG